ncbi:putative UDP-N-ACETYLGLUCOSAMINE--PEPTIDE N-ACETYLGLUCOSAMINYLTRANSFERASE SUBUNIT [Thiomonas sp. X19]|uniref:tetratricopeptide repeat protein n=1 Tax=Thiomonas sp. X19 TaxID=1050370 RepID=UPI000B6F5290|nr:tetratricopeptide repeat protein [Thiomonas sp. X19]SCC92199.1 putative UDP-N-ACETYLGLUCOSAMINE--PEPTIDE N-ACETYLGLUCOSAMINYLTRANSFERASE SUBUNIT [Thiomonas sp. X19]
MRLAVLAAALLAASSWLHPAQAAAPEAQSGRSVAAAMQDDQPGAQDLARWFYAVLTGEIAANTGHPAVAYTELLKAARDMNSEPLFERATEVAVAAGAPEQALAAVNAWRSAQPESLKAQTWAAQLLVALGRNADAVSAISRIIAITPQPQRPKAILSLAPLFAHANDPRAAINLAKKSLAPYQAMPQSSLVTGLLQARAGDAKLAFAAASKALAADHGMQAAAALLLQTYTVNPQQADALLQQYFVAKPDDANLRLAWIQAALGQQRDGIALTQAQALSATKPDLPEGWLILGSLQLQQEQVPLAQKSLLTYLSLVGKSGVSAAHAGSARAYLALADAARKQHDYPQAEHWLAQIPAGQESLAVALQKATILAEQNKLNAGLELLDKLPNATPEQQRERLFARAQLYRTAKQYSQAYGVLKPGLAQFGKDADYVYETAMMAEKAGDTAEMETLLRRIIAANTRYQPAYNALGYTLADQGKQLPQALKLVAHALKLSPGNPFVLDSMGWVQFRMGDLKAARTALEQAYAARQDPEIAAHLAEVLWHQGDKARARKILHEAFDRAPLDDVVKAAMQRMDVRF